MLVLIAIRSPRPRAYPAPNEKGGRLTCPLVLTGAA
jgi:hypothetical protein